MVIAVIGLLVGGVVGARSMIRSSELQSLAKQLDTYNTAIVNFNGKYFALPGDMPNATRFWKGQDGNDAEGVRSGCMTLNTVTATIKSPATCNGDGDGVIKGSTSFFERCRFWQHLSNAGMISESYTGICLMGASGTMRYVPGTNVPKAKFNDGYFLAMQNSTAAVPIDYIFPTMTSDNVIFVAGPSTGNAGQSRPLLPAIDMLGLDTKLDDGLPGQGKLQGPNPRKADNVAGTAFPSCVTTNNPATAKYNVTNRADTCIVWQAIAD